MYVLLVNLMSLHLLQCFDTVGLVIWPVKIIPEMTYNVLSGTLSIYTTTTVVLYYRETTVYIWFKFSKLTCYLHVLVSGRKPSPSN